MPEYQQGRHDELQVILLDYITRYGLTEMARQFFLSERQQGASEGLDQSHWREPGDPRQEFVKLHTSRT